MALKPRARFECYPGNLVPQWHVTGGYADIWHDDLCIALVRWHRIQSMALAFNRCLSEPLPSMALPSRWQRFGAWVSQHRESVAAVIGALAGLVAWLLWH